MSYQIAFDASEDCAKELLKKGFERREVWIRPFSKVAEGKSFNSDNINAAGDADFFAMKNKPYQFVTTSYWGASQD